MDIDFQWLWGEISAGSTLWGQILFIFHASGQAEGKTEVLQASSEMLFVLGQEVSEAAHERRGIC